MIGSCYLQLELADLANMDEEPVLLSKGKTSLMRAVELNPRYHQAFANLALAVSLEDKDEEADEITRLYLEQFNNDLSLVNRAVFGNRALRSYRNQGNQATPGLMKWLLLASLCTGGVLTAGKKMLQELKTLYVLNAHEYGAAYLDSYRSALRTNQESFIEDLRDDNLHSALLFFIAHALHYSAITMGRGGEDLRVELDGLDDGIDLNAEALYFNRRNNSAERLVQSQVQLLQYLSRRTEKRWEDINTKLGQRFQMYEDYLREQRSAGHLKSRLAEIGREELVPRIQVSRAVRLKMDGVIDQEQRQRIRDRVMVQSTSLA